MRRTKGLAGALCLAVLISAPAWAQDFFIYPTQGQGPQQQERDRFECHSWAVQQTGFDPTRAAPPPTAAPPPQEPVQGGVVRGGLRGATVGVVGGAIAGDAGKGAAIGGATGALIGGFRRQDQLRRQQAQQQQYAQAQAQQQAAYHQHRDAYNRAMAACLQGRGYTVN